MAYTILTETYGRRLPKITAEATSISDLEALGTNYAEGSICTIGSLVYKLDKVKGWVFGNGEEASADYNFNANICVTRTDDGYRLFPTLGSIDGVYMCAFCGWSLNQSNNGVYVRFTVNVTNSEWKRVSANSGSVKARHLVINDDEIDFPPEDLDENNATTVAKWVSITITPANYDAPILMADKSRFVRIQYAVFDSDDNMEYCFYSPVCELAPPEGGEISVNVHYDSKQKDNCIYDLHYSLGTETGGWLMPQNYATVFRYLFTGDKNGDYNGRYVDVLTADIPNNRKIFFVALAGTDRYLWSPGIMIDTPEE